MEWPGSSEIVPVTNIPFRNPGIPCDISPPPPSERALALSRSRGLSLSLYVCAQGKSFMIPSPRVRRLKAEEKHLKILLSLRCSEPPKRGKICKDAFNS